MKSLKIHARALLFISFTGGWGEKKQAQLAPTGVWGCLHDVDQVKVKL